jgi:hypothetical protein
MKKYIFLLLLIGIFISCEKNNDSTELVGKWELIEILADPGDGSGVFQTVESDKIIAFHADGTITSNGLLCEMSIQSNTSGSGTYFVEGSAIYPSDCRYAHPGLIELSFELNASTYKLPLYRTVSS